MTTFSNVAVISILFFARLPMHRWRLTSIGLEHRVPQLDHDEQSLCLYINALQISDSLGSGRQFLHGSLEGFRRYSGSVECFVAFFWLHG